MSIEKAQLINELVQLEETARKLHQSIQSVICKVDKNLGNNLPSGFNDYLEQVNALIGSGHINQNHYAWSDDGRQLKIWAREVWNIYSRSLGGHVTPVGKEMVRRKFLAISNQKRLITVNFKNGKGGYTRQKGYRIENAHKYENLAKAFNCPLLKTD